MDSCLESVDLAGLSECDVRELSGGELQRARLARALVQEPRLLLLDEPTAHLDLGHEARFMELVGQYTDTQSVTVVAVTHHLNVSARFADQMVLLASGHVLKQGRPDEVLTPSLLAKRRSSGRSRWWTWGTSAGTRLPGGVAHPVGSCDLVRPSR